jgi:nucleoside-diphosphate-sugar epimerase
MTARVLVTGAAGFLGRRVVTALRARGYPVRALVRRPAGAVFPEPVEIITADLATSADLGPAVAGIDAVLHLATPMRGDAESILRDAVLGTRRLLDAVERSSAKRFVLASSLSVYDFEAAGGVLDEGSALERRPDARDAYTAAKLRQEELCRESCARSGIALTVLRPAYVWGTGREFPPTLGLEIGPLRVLVAPSRTLPSIHVENCADAFAEVLRAGDRADGTFDLVDFPEVTARAFLADLLRTSGRSGVVLPVPYAPSRALVRLVHGLAPRRLRERLPSFFGPARFAARFRPVRVTGSRFRERLGWRPPVSRERCLERTFPAPPR